MDDLARWRDEFPILSRTVYMISNSLGAMPRQTARNLAEYADTWATRGVRALGRALVGDAARGRQQDRARSSARRPASVSMHENVTTAHMVALSCAAADPAARRRIVCSAMDFPSMIYLYRAQQAAGFELRVVPAEDDLSRATPSACSTRSTSATAVVAVLARAVPHVVHHGRGARSSRARTRSARR